MSILSNIHTVTGYVSGTTKAFDGQRLAKMTYKVDKTTGIKPESKAVSIPVIAWADIEPHLSTLQSSIIAMVHRAQDGVVRELVEAGAEAVRDDQIAVSVVIAAMLEDGGRLTGDTIRAWFVSSLHDPLMLAFAPKLGIGENSAPTVEQSNKLEKILKGYEDSFAKLASGAASFNDTQKANMIKAMQLIEDFEEDVLVSKFTARLSKVSEDEMLMNL